jgi:hypothetical protein
MMNALQPGHVGMNPGKAITVVELLVAIGLNNLLLFPSWSA